MRQKGNTLDLNILPEDYASPECKLTFEDTSNAVYRKKKSGGKDDPGKVYKCRFCSLKFCKSQALGGHMNRHRQERETETLNKARQLVFTNDLSATTQLGYASTPVYCTGMFPYIYTSPSSFHPQSADYIVGHVQGNNYTCHGRW